MQAFKREIGDFARHSVRESVRCSVWGSVWGSVVVSVWNSVVVSVWGNINESLDTDWNSVRESVGSLGKKIL